MKTFLQWLGIIFLLLIFLGFIAALLDDGETSNTNNNLVTEPTNITTTETEQIYYEPEPEPEPEPELETEVELTPNTEPNMDFVPEYEPEVEITAMPITAGELLSAYESNEMAADRNYKGKILQVTGIVESVESGPTDNAILSLGTGSELEFVTVDASGNEAFDEATIDLNKGQQVTVICRSDGEVMGYPQLIQCVIP